MRLIRVSLMLQGVCHPGSHKLQLTNMPPVLEDNVGLDPKTSLLLGGVIQIMQVIGKSPTTYPGPPC